LLWRNKFSPVTVPSHDIYSRDASDSNVKAMDELHDITDITCALYR